MVIRLVNTEEAAKILGKTRRHVTRLCREGKIQSQKVGRDWIMFEPRRKYQPDARD